MEKRVWGCGHRPLKKAAAPLCLVGGSRRSKGPRRGLHDYVRRTLTLRKLGRESQCTVEVSLETAAFLYSVENGGGGGEMLVLPASGAMLVLL